MAKYNPNNRSSRNMNDASYDAPRNAGSRPSGGRRPENDPRYARRPENAPRYARRPENDPRYARRPEGNSRYAGDPYYRAPQQRPKKKKKHVALFVILAIVVILLAAGAFLAINAKTEIGTLKEQAYELRDDLKETLEDVKGMDADAAEKSIDRVDQDAAGIKQTLAKPFWKIATVVPVYGQDVQTINKLINVLDSAGDDVLRPFVSLIREYPLSKLKETENGLNVGIILAYLDFLDETAPSLHEISDNLSGIKFNTVDIDVNEYAEKFTTLFEALDTASEYKDLLRAFLGNGNDRQYLVMAQNSAEIRASGGFPGSMGMIDITDGILSIGDFSSIVNYVYQSNTPEANITERESELFQYMYTSWAHDACYNPHFAKVAHITKTGYDVRHGGNLDGIISLTPVIIQQILEITGEEIHLDDGTVLDGDNATKVLQRDLYLKYQNEESTAYENNDYIDPLFAETAKQAIGLLFRNFSLDKVSDYLNFFVQGGKDRTIMLWFADEEEEEISIRSGCSGNLNSDPENPQAGVYFSCCDASKLGMFTEIDTEISEPKTNKKGRQVYTVTVTLNNYLDEYFDDGFSASYLIGNNAGAIQSYVYFFAPAGGKVSDFETSNGMEVAMSEYEGLEVGYLLDLFLQPGEPVTVTYKVTTAEGVTTPLEISSTPTLQDYK